MTTITTLPTAPAMLLTVQEAAQMLRISRAKLYQLIQKGEVRTVKIAASRRVPVAALQEYVERLMQQDDNSA
jgi:excisionase family DNA binding protein